MKFSTDTLASKTGADSSTTKAEGSSSSLSYLERLLLHQYRTNPESISSVTSLNKDETNSKLLSTTHIKTSDNSRRGIDEIKLADFTTDDLDSDDDDAFYLSAVPLWKGTS
jgi:hypothetical protein